MVTVTAVAKKETTVNEIVMASLHMAILALSIHEQDVQKRSALFTLAHYYKLDQTDRALRSDV
jgi:hypothetical protein